MFSLKKQLSAVRAAEPGRGVRPRRAAGRRLGLAEGLC